MPWLTVDIAQCNCPVPEGPLHSTVRLNTDSIWQCPKCQRLWKPNPYGRTFKEHQLGPNDYWYTVDFQKAY